MTCEMRQLHTLLLYTHNKFEDVLSSSERDVTLAIFDILEQNLDGAISTLPVWFATSEKEWSFAQRSALIGNEKECVRQVELWAKLNHPNFRKFYGACHVGVAPYAIHDESSQLSPAKVCQSEDIWELLLDYAHGLQYVHSRRLVHAAFSMEHLCLTWDEKHVLSGLGLVSSLEVKTESNSEILGSESLDVLSFGLAVFVVLAMARIADKDAISRIHVDRLRDAWLECVQATEWSPMVGTAVTESPTESIIVEVVRKMNKSEWNLLAKMCAEEPREIITVANVIYLMKDLAGTNPRSSTEVDSVKVGMSADAKNNCCQYVLPLSGLTLQEMLDNLQEQCNENEADNCGVYKRLVYIYAQFQDAQNPVPPSTVEHFGTIVHEFVARVDRRFDKVMGSIVRASVILSVADRNYGVHCQLDALLGRSNMNSEHAAHQWQSQFFFNQNDDQQQINITSTWLLSSEQVQLGEPIGRGAFGEAFRGKWLGTDVVVKMVLSNQRIIHFRQQFYHEAELWFSLNHASLTKLYGAC